MREIKFRCYSENIGMLTPCNVEIHSDGNYFIKSEFWSSYANEFILMQYTGLKDKNGTEIYEGDIYSLELENCNGKIEVQTGVIVWESEKARFSNKVINCPIFKSGTLGVIHFEQCEVIGNIHQNPELL